MNFLIVGLGNIGPEYLFTRHNIGFMALDYLAKEKSIDPGSKDKGGDLGWFSPASMVKPFSDVTANLQKGAVSASPVQTQFGWHVIKLIDTRPAQPLAYEKVKDGLQKNLQQRQLEKMMADLRSKAKVDIAK